MMLYNPMKSYLRIYNPSLYFLLNIFYHYFELEVKIFDYVINN